MTNPEEPAQKDHARVKLPPPLLPLATVLAGVGLKALWPLNIGWQLSPLLRHWLGGLVIAGAILGLGLWAVITMRRTGQTENPYQPSTEIVDKGPFRFTRNPMYLQMVIACIGFAILLWNLWILLLTPLCAWALQKSAILPEERYLEEKFGEAYLDYKRRVRRWL